METTGSAARRGPKRATLVLLLVGVASVSAFGLTVHPAAAKPTTRFITIHAGQWAFDPTVVEVNQGDTVYIIMKSLDVSHGIYIEGYDVGAQLVLAAREPNQTVFHFVANKAGTFIIRCDLPCGFGHPLMTGALKVDPNNNFLAAGFLAVLIALLSSAYFVMSVQRTPAG